MTCEGQPGQNLWKLHCYVFKAELEPAAQDRGSLSSSCETGRQPRTFNVKLQLQVRSTRAALWNEPTCCSATTAGPLW